MSDYFKQKDLEEQRGRIFDKQKKILQDAEDEGRGLTEEEQEKFDNLEEKDKELRQKIENIEKVKKKEKILEEKRGQKADKLTHQTGQTVVEDQVKEKEEKEVEVFAKYLAFGALELDNEERSVLQGLKTTIPKEARAQASGTDSKGGYTVPEGFSNEIESALQAFGGMLEAARIFETSSGNDLPWPTEDNTSQKGEILSENTQVNTQDVDFDQTTLGAYWYSSKLVRISLQLLQDSAFDMESFVGTKLGERIARIINEHFTTGSGSSQPNGVVTASSAGNTTSAADAFTFQEVIGLKHSVDPAYRTGSQFMLSDNTLAEMKKLSIGSSDARPLWQPSFVVGEPNRIDGDPYTINQDMADAGTAANKFMLYGDFSKYIIRRVLGFQMTVLRERYADYHQIGILGFSRFDGDLIDAGAGAVKHMAHAAS